MWILSFLPSWIVHAVPIAGLAIVLISMFLKFIPFISTYYAPIRIVGFVLFCFGIFFEGSLYNDLQWQARVKEMEAKVAKAEVKSKEENKKIETKVIIKTQIVKQRGENILKYIDKEIVKYDNQCIIPQEFIKAHNDAAEKVK